MPVHVETGLLYIAASSHKVNGGFVYVWVWLLNQGIYVAPRLASLEIEGGEDDGDKLYVGVSSKDLMMEGVEP